MSQIESRLVALVTGGSRGIGAAIARRLALCGIDVALTYVSSADKAAAVVTAITAEGGRAISIHADSGAAEAVKGAVRATVEHFGRLDILVNNAGISVLGTVDTFSLATFDRMVAVNIRAAFAATQEAAQHMAAGGRIITIGSAAADRPFAPGMAFYSMTKAAVAAMTRGFALDLAPRAITVNTIQPGPIATDMTPESDGHKNMVPLKRFGTADEVAGLVEYLIRPEAAFITGASLMIDGGVTIA